MKALAPLSQAALMLAGWVSALITMIGVADFFGSRGNSIDQGDAVDLRHHHVGEDEGWLTATKDGHRFDCAVRAEDFELGNLEQVGNNVAKTLVVIDDKDGKIGHER